MAVTSIEVCSPANSTRRRTGLASASYVRPLAPTATYEYEPAPGLHTPHDLAASPMTKRACRALVMTMPCTGTAASQQSVHSVLPRL